MKGIELSEKYYNEYGAPMLEREFPQLLPLIAIGIAGSGSECFGYDDEISRDHDFEAGFCIFLPDESIIDRRAAFALERAYAKLPDCYMGIQRPPLSPVGGNRRGVIRAADFFLSKSGTTDGELHLSEWLSLPEQALAEAVNGKIFRDDSGFFTAIRQKLAYLPEGVRLKKLAGHLLMMGQAGQYNFPRCMARGEEAAAQLAAVEFIKSALQVIFLLNRRYLPYYKWQFRALREQDRLSDLAPLLEYLLAGGAGNAAERQRIMEQVCTDIFAELRRQGLSSYSGSEAEGYAYAVNDKIEEPALRNLHILAGI